MSKINKFRRVISIARAILGNRAQTEKAYIGNFWSELGSTMTYVVTYLITLDLLFRRVGQVAGFDRNDFFFISFIGQFTFYLVSGLLFEPMVELIDSVRKGNFDSHLLKPVSTRLLVYCNGVRPLYTAFTAIPNLILFALVLDWSQLNISVMSALGGVLVFAAGFIITKFVLFMLAYPVFVQGESSDAINIYYSLPNGAMPYDKTPSFIKILSFNLLSVFLMTVGAGQVILQKGSAPTLILALSLVSAAMSVLVFNYMWRRAMLNYTSASS